MRILIFLLLIALLPLRPAAQSAADFREAYLSEYQQAEQWLCHHLPLHAFIDMRSSMAIAAAFPELVRYNELSDFIETTALELLYVQHGSRIVDFSIGHFQMKPSFVESLEKLADCPLVTAQQRQWLQLTHLPPQEARRLRIERLKSPLAQVQYLLIFERIASWQRAADFALRSTKEQIRRLAVFYNAGLHISSEQLHYHLQTPLFPYGRRYHGPQYCYADIAWYAYATFFGIWGCNFSAV
jgi:hypothetical protein